MAWTYTQPSHNSGWSDQNTNILWENHWSVTEQTPDAGHPGKIRLRVSVTTENYHVQPTSYVSPVTDTISCGGETVEIHSGTLTPASHDYTYTEDVYVPLSWSGKSVELYICWTRVSVVCGAAGDFGSTLSAADGTFGSPLSLSFTRKVTNVTHSVRIVVATDDGPVTVNLLSESAAASATWNPSVSYYASRLRSAMSTTAAITLTTHYGGATMTDTKTVTMRLPAAGVKPEVSAGWAAHAHDNTGTAAASIDAYVQGYSRATVSFDASKISLKYGATIAGYKIVCGGVTVTSAPYRTGTLTGTVASIVCTVTDSRGQTASGNLSVSLYAYAKPTITGVSIYRSNASGTADEDGTYIAVTATANISSLGGRNSGTMKVYTAAGSGSYTDKGTLTSGTRKILSTYSTDTSYRVKIELTDALGNTASYTQLVSTAAWAMKFRPTGNGVAFGKAAENAKSLEMPSDWVLRFGAKQFQPGIISGSIETGDTAAESHAVGSYFTWKSNHVKCTAAIAAGDAIAGKVSQMSVDYALANKEVKTYTNVSQLGLTSGSATIAAAYEALPTNAMLVAWPGQFASGELPHSYGAVFMVKAGYAYRGFVRYCGKMLAYDDYHMPLDDNQTPNGHWQRDVSLYDAGTASTSLSSWYYRKWSDGRVEAWGTWTADVAITTAGYGAYRSAEISVGLPAALGLTGADYWISAQKANANAAQLMSLYPSSGTLAKMYLRDHQSETVSCKLNLYVCGTWR